MQTQHNNKTTRQNLSFTSIAKGTQSHTKICVFCVFLSCFLDESNRLWVLSRNSLCWYNTTHTTCSVRDEIARPARSFRDVDLFSNIQWYSRTSIRIGNTYKEVVVLCMILRIRMIEIIIIILSLFLIILNSFFIVSSLFIKTDDELRLLRSFLSPLSSLLRDRSSVFTTER